MNKGLNTFQKNIKLFTEQLAPISAKSTEYAGVEDDLDSILLLADRILAACQEDLDFNRVSKIGEHLEKLNSDVDSTTKIAEELLEDIELWLKVVLSFSHHSVWQSKKGDKNYSYVNVVRDLGLLKQAEIDLDIDSYHKISDKFTQLVFLAYRYRNPLTHSPEEHADHIKALFLPAAICALIAPIYKHEAKIRDELEGLIVSSFTSENHTNILTLINSERQKHLTNFRAREDWVKQLVEKLRSRSEEPKSYILLHAIEGMGKSALVAKITEELSANTHVIGRNSGMVRKNAPWLPDTIVHFGKQSNQTHEIIDILLAQMNTLLLEPIDIEEKAFMSREYSNVKYFSNEMAKFGVYESIQPQAKYLTDRPYSIAPSSEFQHDPFQFEAYDLTRYRRVLYLALQQIVKEKGNITLIIDAVDEISTDGSGLQFLPETLPVGVSALLSARETKVVKWLDNNRDVEILRLKELKKNEIPLFTGVKNEDGDMQARFNERVWKTSSGWPLMVLEASRLAQEHVDDLDHIRFDKSKLFERQVNEWRSARTQLDSEVVKEIMILMAIFEPVSPLDLDLIQAFIERNGDKYSRDEIKQSLQFVTSQIEGLDANRIKLALKAFAEFIREQWLGKLDLQRKLEEIVHWLANKEYDDREIISQFLDYWTSISHSKAVRETAISLLDIFIKNNDAETLYSIYRGLRKQSKRSSNLTDIMKRCLISAAEFGNASAMRTFGWRLMDGNGVEKDITKGIDFLEKAAQKNDIQAKELLANYYIDGIEIQKNIELGIKWLMEAIDTNDEHAKYIYATRLLDGNGLPQDVYKGEAVLRELADNGYVQALFSLSGRLIEGDVIEQDIEAGEKLLRELSVKNDQAKLFLANRLIDGKVLQTNLVEGEKLLREMVKNGNRDATVNLWSRLHYGHGLQVNLTESISLLSNLANIGDVEAMQILGNILIEGDQIPANPDEGKKWLVKAADSEHVVSMLMLSGYLLDGKGLEKNKKEGKLWLDKAVATQDSRAMQILGSRLVEGVGLPRNKVDGIKWLQKAVDANNSRAMVIIGKKMLYGEDIEKNIKKGEELLQRAASNENTEAMRVLGNELMEGKALTKNEKEGEMLLRTAAEDGNPTAMLDLAIRLFEGDGLTQNTSVAQTWIDKAIENGNNKAKAYLGTLKIQGNVIEKDVEYGEELLSKAAKDGDVQAKRILGAHFIENKSDEEVVKEGVRLVKEAIEEDDKAAIHFLATALFDGTKLPKDEREAKRLLKKLVQMNDVVGIRNLGGRLLFGDGVNQDVQEGLKLLNRALEKGDGHAAGNLGRYYYQTGNLEMATTYLLKGVELDSDNAKNNFSFILRRGEAVGVTNILEIDKLLLGIVEKKDLFASINYALCLAKGFQCQKNWQKADVIISSLPNSDDPVSDALDWWHKYLISKNDDPEGHLVVGWLVRHKFIEDPDNMTITQRMVKARNGGWDVPEWMNSVVE